LHSLEPEMKILLATDGSDHSLRAAKFVADHAAWLKQAPGIHLVTVHLPIPLPGAAAAVGHATVEKYYRDESEVALKGVSDLLRQRGVAFVEATRVGAVEKEINQYVADHAIDLIVMGSHGRTALASVAMGSVAAKLIATATVPITIVR
jgi:nucleotide-binding universal stress UspA family protein